jgi:Ca2+-binding RTX toxin-like protein
MTNLMGTNGNDDLSGSILADEIHALNGDDILNGEAGNDILDGGLGSDTYVFKLGSGQDTILAGGAASDQDVIALGEGIKPEDVVLRSNFEAEYFTDLDGAGQSIHTHELGWTLSIKGSTDTLQVNGAFDEATQAYVIKKIQFADGTVWGTQDIKSALLLSTSGDDRLLGYESADDVITGGGGHDRIYGQGGNDVVDGGAGDDRIFGQNGNDQIKGGAGNDFLLGGRGYDSLWGGSGDDRIHGDDGNDRLFGGDGNDLLKGGNGDDYFDGGAGNDRFVNESGVDTYVFGRGDGQDSLDFLSSGSPPRGPAEDRIRFRAGIRAEDVLVRDNGFGDMELTFKNSTQGESLRVSGPGLASVGFADGTVWDFDKPAGDEGNNVLFNYSGRQASLSGLGGNDTLNGGRTADMLLGGDGNDVLLGGAGDDTLRGQNGDDKLYGDAGNDTLAGGAGSDLLSGGDGNDTYQFGSGSQSDTIVNADTTGAGLDKLLIGLDTPTTQAQVWLQRNGNDLKVALIGTGDNVTVKDWYGAGAASGRLDALQMGNGKQLLATQVDVLVNAMAAFAPPAAGQTTLPSSYQAVLNPVIAANWT